MIDIRNAYAAARQFFREVRAELKRVTWATRKETIGATSVVLVLVIIVAVFLGIVDFGVHALILKILS